MKRKYADRSRCDILEWCSFYHNFILWSERSSVRVIPVSLKQAVSAGIGLFIALLGAKNCG